MTDVELIKTKIDIVEFIGEHIQLKKAGRNFKALCPFHSEKTPSFLVSPERQSWHCFGACGEGGDVVSFLQKWENIEFLEALKILAQKAGVKISSYQPSDSLTLKEKLYEINHLASEFYHYLLTSHKLGLKAREYLKNRGVKPETINKFTLGYAPASWDSLLRYLSKKGYQLTDIQTAGLLVKSEGGRFYDRFRGRLMFALKDHRGNIVGFSGRKLPPENEKEAKYINTAETPIYSKGHTLYGLEVTKEMIKKEKEAVLVEGEFDFLASFQHGVANVVAIKGSALTEDQVLLLKRFTEDLVFGLDSDFAGNEAAKRGIEIAENAGLTVRVVQLPYGKDPAECVEKSPSLWQKAVKEAIPIYDFVIDHAFGKYTKSDAISKKKIGAEVVPYLAKINNPIVLSHYTKQLAKRLEVAEESIELTIRQFQKKKQTLPFQITKSVKTSGEPPLEEYLLSLLIQSSQPAEAINLVLQQITPDDFREPVIKRIFELLIPFLKTHDRIEAPVFNKVLTPEITAVFDRAFMLDIEKIMAQKEIYDRELKRAVREVKKKSLRRSIESLSTKIRNLEDTDEENKVGQLREQMRELLSQVKALN